MGCTLLKRGESYLWFCFKEGGGTNSTQEDPRVTAELPPDVILLVIRFQQMNWDGGGGWHGVGGNHMQSNPTRRVIPSDSEG